MKKYITIKKYFELQENSKKKSNKIKIFWYIIIILCLITFIFSIYNIFKWQLDNIKVQKLHKEIGEDISLSNSTENGKWINPPDNKDSNYYYYVNFPLYQVDFSKLLAKNKDTVAYIHLNDTLVNYPVVQTSDNTYYLNHTFDNKKNNAGWIFMDYRNNINELNDNIIIYGHSRIDKTLFGSLHNVLQSSWQKKKDNYVIYLSTLQTNMLFQIFSIYTIEKENYYMIPNFSNEVEKQKWIDAMKKRNIAPITTEVNVKDKFLTLSTCLDTKGGRIVIHAKLIKMQKSKNT